MAAPERSWFAWPRSTGLVAILVGGMVLGWSLGRSTSEGEAGGGDVPRETTAREGAPTLQGRPDARVAPGASADPSADPSPRTSEPDPASAVAIAGGEEVPPDAAFGTRIEVEVVSWEGETAEGDEVYAVPVGATWTTDDDPPWPSASTSAEGRAIVTLPKEGHYDIGARRGSLHALVRDVFAAAGRKTPVQIRLPEAADLVLTLAPEAGQMRGRLSVQRADGEGIALRRLPTRAERATFDQREMGVPSEMTEMTLRLPKGVPATVVLEHEGRVYQPEEPTVTAPGRIRLSRSNDLEPLVVRVSFRVPPGSEALPVELRMWFGGGGQADAGMRVDDVRANPEASLTLMVRVRSGFLRWEGHGIVASRVEVPTLVSGQHHTMEVDVEVVAAEPFDALAGVDVAEVPGEPTVKEAHIWTWRMIDGDVHDLNGAPLDQPYPVGEGDAGKQALVAWGPWWASEVVTLPRQGRARIPVQPAGWLLAQMERPPPVSHGRLTVLRADGAWVGVAHGESLRSGGFFDLNESFGPGSLLGPLPEGPVELVVRAGGVEIGRLHATVRANRITSVRCPW